MRAELPGGSGTTSPILAHLGGPSTFALLPASQVSSCELLCSPDFGHSTLLLIRSAAGTSRPGCAGAESATFRRANSTTTVNGSSQADRSSDGEQIRIQERRRALGHGGCQVLR
jgi:hypothetical protein